MGIKPWKVLEESTIDQRGPFKVVSSVRENPRTGYQIDFLRIECVDWVSTIPLTADGEVVLIKQYRQAANEVSIEIPGGCAYPNEVDFKEAARRELLEETGYDSDTIEFLGVVHPNPGLMPTRQYYYVARNVVKTSLQDLDQGEDIEVIVKPVQEVFRMIKEGEIIHSLCVAAFGLLLMKYPQCAESV